MLRRIRAFFARHLERFLIGPEPVSIISEDCWGGEFCRALERPYTTPLAGAFIPSQDYLNFLESLSRSDAFEIEPVPGSESYPVGRTPYATIHFLHFEKWDEAKEKFQRRARRIAWQRLCYKIDFGKTGYTQRDVERWNSLRLPHAVALIPSPAPAGLDFTGTFNAVPVRNWCGNGEVMFYVARRCFDFHAWVRTGKIGQSFFSQVINGLFCDPYYPAYLKEKIRGTLRKT